MSDGGKSTTVSVKCKDYGPKPNLRASVEDVLRDGKVVKGRPLGAGIMEEDDYD
jgi:hypothetical protein